MKILVTGGAGYLGSVLVQKLLQKEHKVRVLDALMFGGNGVLPFLYNKNYEFIKGDIRNEKTVKEAVQGIEVVFHLAALVGEPACSVNPQLTEEINHISAVMVGNKAKELGIKRFIFISTCSNYGVSDSNALATEESPLNPLSLYAETKIRSEKEFLKLSDDRFVVTILRLATIFGLSPRMRFNLLINEMARESVTKKKVVIYKEDSWRPYTHISDAADALISVLEAPVGKTKKEVFNVGTENYQKKELVNLIKEYVPDLEIDKKGGLPDNRDYRVSFEKIKNVIGFAPKLTVKLGVDELFNAVSNGFFDNLYEKTYDSWINEKVLDKL